METSSLQPPVVSYFPFRSRSWQYQGIGLSGNGGEDMKDAWRKQEQNGKSWSSLHKVFGDINQKGSQECDIGE